MYNSLLASSCPFSFTGKLDSLALEGGMGEDELSPGTKQRAAEVQMGARMLCLEQSQEGQGR